MHNVSGVQRLAGFVLGLSALSGCSWGLRAGTETLVYVTGPVVIQAVATGYSGVGSTSRGQGTSSSEGLHLTATVRAGSEVREGGLAIAGLGGIEWFHIPEERSRLGYHLGLDAGVSGRGEDSHRTEFISQARGGPMLRIGQRRWGEGMLLNVGLDGTLGVAGSLNPRVNSAAFFMGFAITFGFTSVHRAHL